MKLKYFKLAQNVASKSSSYPKMGCVIVKKNRVVSVGFNNREKTHPKSKTMGHTLHAELHAIIGVDPADLKGAHVYVFREHLNGDLAMAKPCAVCHAVLSAAGVRRVFYTTYGGHDGYDFKSVRAGSKK